MKMDLVQIARILALFGIFLLVTAGALYIMSRFGLPLGNLPGDLVIRRENFTCAVPLVSSLIISVILTIIINLILALIRR
jgi:hypothetical protein